MKAGALKREPLPVVSMMSASLASYLLGYVGGTPGWIIPFRVVVAVPSVLIVPGYLLIMLFAQDSAGKLEGYLLAVGLSLAIIGIWAVLLDMAGLPVTAQVVGFPTLLVSLAAGAILIFRWKRNG